MAALALTFVLHTFSQGIVRLAHSKYLAVNMHTNGRLCSSKISRVINVSGAGNGCFYLAQTRAHWERHSLPMESET